MCICKQKLKFPVNCPVCGKEKFENPEQYRKNTGCRYFKSDKNSKEKIEIDEIEAKGIHCLHCGWYYDANQLLDYDYVGTINDYSVNELRKKYQDKLKENPNYYFQLEPDENDGPHKCPVCNKHKFKYTFSYDICPICGWIDDGTEDDPDDDYSEVNVISISEAKKEFQDKRKKNPKYKYKDYEDD